LVVKRPRPAAVLTGVACAASIAAIVALALRGAGQTQPRVPSSGRAPTRLLATVNPTGGVTLTTTDGRTITRLPSGSYTIVVRVDSAHADFHLIGPGLNRASKADVASLGLWGVQLVSGTYHYGNDQSPRGTTRVVVVY
jgi:hypothetical protein